MKTIKKTLSLMMSLLILIAAMPFTAQAASENTLRNSVVSVASNEVGYTGTSTYSKYGDWYGYQGSWCTTFVFWCFNKAGSNNGVKLFGSAIPSGGNCNSMISWFSSKGRYRERSSGYTPKKGDLVFFDWNSNDNSDHVGIVTGTSGSTVYTVEGNCSGKVKSRTYTSSGSKPYNNISSIMGYGVPIYSSASSDSSDEEQTTKKSTTTKKSSSGSASVNSSKNNNSQNNSDTQTTQTETSEESTITQVELKSLEIRAATYDLQVGDSVKLHYSVEPSDAPAVVGYFCDEEDVIEIGTDGNIKAIGTGTATVVVCANNELYKQCDFNVSEPVAEVTRHAAEQTKPQSDSSATDETNKNTESMLMEMGINIEALSQNSQLYIIPVSIAAGTLIICVFVAIVKRIKKSK